MYCFQINFNIHPPLNILPSLFTEATKQIRWISCFSSISTINYKMSAVSHKWAVPIDTYNMVKHGYFTWNLFLKQIHQLRISLGLSKTVDTACIAWQIETCAVSYVSNNPFLTQSVLLSQSIVIVLISHCFFWVCFLFCSL